MSYKNDLNAISNKSNVVIIYCEEKNLRSRIASDTVLPTNNSMQVFDSLSECIRTIGDCLYKGESVSIIIVAFLTRKSQHHSQYASIIRKINDMCKIEPILIIVPDDSKMANNILTECDSLHLTMKKEFALDYGALLQVIERQVLRLVN